MPQQPSQDLMMIALSPELIAKVRNKCKTLNMSLEEVAAPLFTSWLSAPSQNAPDRSNELQTVPERFARMLAAETFMEWMPNEACIKDTASRLIWCNGLFTQMTGKPFEAIVNKDPFEIWNLDPKTRRED